MDSNEKPVDDQPDDGPNGGTAPAPVDPDTASPTEHGVTPHGSGTPGPRVPTATPLNES
jgi:hypothetical protein